MLVAGCGRLGFDDRAVTAIDAPVADAGPFTLRGPGTWSPLPPAPLAARVWTSAIWTGDEMVVYGGATDTAYTPTDTGARFNPATGVWTPMATSPSPAPRHTARMALVGDHIIEYGGGSFFDGVAGGGSFDLTTNAWSVSASTTPGPRIYGVIAPMGDRVLTFGGWSSTTDHVGTAFVYDPTSDAWTQTSTANAPSPRSFASAVWTGSEVIVWGGCSGGMPSCEQPKGDGARYDPATDTWTPTSSTGAPSPRAQHAAVWTGSEMIVFGGTSMANEGGPLADGAIYTPATDTWRPIATAGAPPPRVDAGAAWLVDKMVVWGGDTGQDDGFLYDPVADAWSALAVVEAPELAGAVRVRGQRRPAARVRVGWLVHDAERLDVDARALTGF